MKAKILTVIGAILTSSFLYAQDIQVKQGWQLLGATENISASSFNGKCVDYVWKYDNGWKIHIANGSSYTLPSGITEFSTINKGEGFWIRGSKNCDVNTTDNIINIKALLAGKTFYTVDEDDNNNLQVTKLSFNSALSSVQAVSPNSTENWGISIDGNRLTFSDDTDNSYTIIKPMKNYILFEDHNSDGSLDGRGHRLYLDRKKAENYFNSLKNSINDPNNNDFEKVSDLISGHINFIDEHGNSISTPTNVWIRITPQENQIEGNWNGVNCKLDANGNFGAECYVHTNVGSMRKYFNSDYSNTYQFIPYIEKTGDTHFNREEEGFGRLNKTDGTDPFAMHYGDWENATVIVNNS